MFIISGMCICSLHYDIMKICLKEMQLEVYYQKTWYPDKWVKYKE
jgi:hypothetical protein